MMNLTTFSPPARRALLAAALLAAAGAAHAQFKVSASFRNATEPGWTVSGTDNAATNNDSGILTGGYGSIAATGTNDAVGSGWLRLTTRLGNQAGSALYTGGTLPSTLGVVVELDYVSWGGTGADGISVFLYDAAGTMAGALAGGSLYYCFGDGAYIGVGLDEFGNFSSPGASGACSLGGGPGTTPDSVVVRGPTALGNPYVGGTVIASSIDDPGAPARTTPNRVRYFLVPNGSGGYRVSVAYGNNSSVTSSVLSGLNFPYTAPALLRLGVAGSTGGATNVHEVRSLMAAAPADIVVTKTVTAPSVLRGQPVGFTVTVHNNDINPFDPGDQSPPIDGANAPDLVDTLPAELAGASWTCSASAGSTCPAASGVGSIAYSGGYTLAPGGTLSFTITGTVATGAACGATVTNTASAQFSDSDGFADIAPADNSASASFTVQCPRLQVTKTSVGGSGGFGFGGDNGIATHTVTTTASGVAATGALQTLTSAGTATTLTETVPPGYAVTAIACSNLGAGGSATPDLAAGSVVLDAAATLTSGTIACSFTNTRTSLTLAKALPSGRRNAGDQFTLAIAGPGGPASVTTGGSGSTATGSVVLPATPGGAYTLTEAPAGTTVPGDYTTTWACSNSRAGGQTPSGSGTTIAVTPVLGDNLACTFTNAAVPYADLRVTKTAGGAVPAGGTLAYTILATNNGPDAAPGAVLRDSPGAGLDCSQPTGVVACSAAGGAACPAATVPIATLSGAGITIPTFPAGGSVTLTLQCRVTASGS